jgi:hypothetical protein
VRSDAGRRHALHLSELRSEAVASLAMLSFRLSAALQAKALRMRALRTHTPDDTIWCAECIQRCERGTPRFIRRSLMRLAAA